MKSIPLRTEPTVRQAERILSGLEVALVARGAQVTRKGFGLRFRTPRPWATPRPGWVGAATSGRVKVSAGAGEGWKVRYALDFSVLRGLAIVLSLATIGVGFGWTRVALAQVLLALWAIVYWAPRLLASRRFDTLLRASAYDVLERRSAERAEVPPTPAP